MPPSPNGKGRGKGSPGGQPYGSYNGRGNGKGWTPPPAVLATLALGPDPRDSEYSALFARPQGVKGDGKNDDLMSMDWMPAECYIAGQFYNGFTVAAVQARQEARRHHRRDLARLVRVMRCWQEVFGV